MLNGKKIIVVLPAYNATGTLRKTYREIPHEFVDHVILVDDCSSDATVELSVELGIETYRHSGNRGYGANQKTCYSKALEQEADIVVMLHPDYQYTPKLIVAMASLIAHAGFDVVLGSRILGVGALKGGMPRYKYLANRFLTFAQNFMIRYKLSEYHTGFRAYSRRFLESLPLLENSNGFIFDNELLTQAVYFRYTIGEVSCPTRYEPDSSSISFLNSLFYGLGVLHTSLKLIFQRLGLKEYRIFDRNGKSLSDSKSLARYVRRM